jgi:hypothetical protein
MAQDNNGMRSLLEALHLCCKLLCAYLVSCSVLGLSNEPYMAHAYARTP